MPVQPPTIEEIDAAAERLRAVLPPTPLIRLHSYGGGSSIWLKLEIHQPVTSFKVRGILNAVALLTDDQRACGLSTVSAGNTAQALAWAGQRFGVPVRSIMPDTAATAKVEAVRAYGGTPVLLPMAEVFRYLKEHLWEQEPYSFIHPWTNRGVVIGHASLAVEILRELPDVETVFVPVGGGGLLGGVGSALKSLRPEVRVIAVEPAGCPSLHESLRQGRAATVPCHTICDGVAVPYITDEMYPLLASVADESVLVEEHRVKETVRQLAFGNKVVAEPSGALALAAAEAMPHSARGVSVAIVTGGSIDPVKLAAILGSAHA